MLQIYGHHMVSTSSRTQLRAFKNFFRSAAFLRTGHDTASGHFLLVVFTDVPSEHVSAAPLSCVPEQAPLDPPLRASRGWNNFVASHVVLEATREYWYVRRVMHVSTDQVYGLRAKITSTVRRYNRTNYLRIHSDWSRVDTPPSFDTAESFYVIPRKVTACGR